MRIEIELHEGQSEDGETVRIRIIREIRDAVLDSEPTSVTLVRDHDSGVELEAVGGDAEEAGADYQDLFGHRYRLVRRLA